MKFRVGDLLLIEFFAGTICGNREFESAYFHCVKKTKDPKNPNVKIFHFTVHGPKTTPEIPNFIRIGIQGNHWKRKFVRAAHNMTQIVAEDIKVVIRANMNINTYVARTRKKKI